MRINKNKWPLINATTCHDIHGMHWNERFTAKFAGMSLTSIFVNDFH